MATRSSLLALIYISLASTAVLVSCNHVFVGTLSSILFGFSSNKIQLTQGYPTQRDIPAPVLSMRYRQMHCIAIRTNVMHRENRLAK